MAESCSNPGYDNRFTCPACYHDFEDAKAKECPSCKVALHCAVEQQPVCVCTLGHSDDED